VRRGQAHGVDSSTLLVLGLAGLLVTAVGTSMPTVAMYGVARHL
jgi:hypothetical protein